MKSFLSTLLLLLLLSFSLNGNEPPNLLTSKAFEVISSSDDGKSGLTFKAVFQVDNPDDFLFMTLKKASFLKKMKINGEKISLPLKKMKYKIIPAIPTSMLKKGENVLEGEINHEFYSWRRFVKLESKRLKDKESVKGNKSKFSIDPSNIDARLLGLSAKDLQFQSGPILGYAGKTYFTLTCRTNMPAEVILKVNKKKYYSKGGLLHSFKVEGLNPNTEYKYLLQAKVLSKSKSVTSVGPYTVKTFPSEDDFSFVILGDARTFPKDWSKVAKAIVKSKPLFSVFSGDMVTDGLVDSQWDDQFFAPAKEYFATIPFYPVIGNHERNAPIFLKIFPTKDGNNWSEKIGSILLIVIDGSNEWEKGSSRYKWLEDTLSKSKEKFIFLASHYPAWTSGTHGRVDEKTGRCRERGNRTSQEVIMPLLKKYNASAMFAGHDHFYERSEPDNGVTMIISGGAGAPLRDKVKDAKKQNPYSKVFAKKFHYCLLDVKGDECKMKVLTPKNEVIDTFTWKARK